MLGALCRGSVSQKPFDDILLVSCLCCHRNKATLIVEMDTLLYDWLRPKIFAAITEPILMHGEKPPAGPPKGGADERWLYVLLVSCKTHMMMAMACKMHSCHLTMQVKHLPPLQVLVSIFG